MILLNFKFKLPIVSKDQSFNRLNQFPFSLTFIVKLLLAKVVINTLSRLVLCILNKIYLPHLVANNFWLVIFSITFFSLASTKIFPTIAHRRFLFSEKTDNLKTSV